MSSVLKLSATRQHFQTRRRWQWPRRFYTKSDNVSRKNLVKMNLGPLTYTMNQHGDWRLEIIEEQSSKNGTRCIKATKIGEQYDDDSDTSKSKSGRRAMELQLCIRETEAEIQILQAKNNIIVLKNEILKEKVCENRLKIQNIQEEIDACRLKLGSLRKKKE